MAPLTVSCGLLSTPRRAPGAADSGTAPRFALPDQNGRQVTLDDLLSKGPAAVVFYRGYW
jgi:cytochrome oxidase Cu insertion factor (SCO1/SenC/PrrC family)